MLLFLPTVESERLVIRPVRAEDDKDLFEICGDERVVRYLSYPVHTKLSDTRKFIQSVLLANPANGLPEAYVMELKSSHKVIGMCNFVSVRHDDIAEIGYQENYDYWNQGYMSEALETVIETAFEKCGIRRLEIAHSIYNERSQAVIKKAGFRYEGTYRQYIYDKQIGAYADCRHYSILREEWRMKNGKTE